MRSRFNGSIIGNNDLPNLNRANGIYTIHDAAIFKSGNTSIWPLATDYIYSATGGTISIANDDPNYKLHTFTSNGTFTVETGSAYIEVFLVGGGGGGGYAQGPLSTIVHAGGAGGGGGVCSVTSLFVTAGTTFDVEVGQGGAYGSSSQGTGDGNTGTNSSIVSTSGHLFKAMGGGGGGAAISSYTYAGDGLTGGSGGGGAVYMATNGSSYGYGFGGNQYAGPIQNWSSGIYNTYVEPGGQGFQFTTVPRRIYGGGGGGAISWGKGYDAASGQHGYGGDGYYWPRTQLRYGAGGGAFSINVTSSAASAIGSQSGLQGANTRISTSSATAAMSLGNGTGGRGGVGTTTTALTGGTGSDGTVIFCYRYQ